MCNGQARRMKEPLQISMLKEETKRIFKGAERGNPFESSVSLFRLTSSN